MYFINLLQDWKLIGKRQKNSLIRRKIPSLSGWDFLIKILMHRAEIYYSVYVKVLIYYNTVRINHAAMAQIAILIRRMRSARQGISRRGIAVTGTAVNRVRIVVNRSGILIAVLEIAVAICS